jgi:hypothetical protein
MEKKRAAKKKVRGSKPRAPRVPKADEKWMSVPEAGRIYYGLSRNGSYDAMARGEIPTVRVGRLLKVPVQAMEQKLSEAGAVTPRRRNKNKDTAEIAA